MKERVKLLVVIAEIHKALEHEWFVSLIDRTRIDLEFAMINGKGSKMDHFLLDHGVKVHYFNFRKKGDLIGITAALFILMKRKKYDIVHAHLIEAYLCGMTAAWMARIPKRIITRHHSDLHHTWHPHAVKYDKLINYLCTDIIAISRMVKDILVNWENADPRKIHIIHHGLDLSVFEKNRIDVNRIENVRKKYNLNLTTYKIGVISRFTEWKGVQFIIPAFREFIKTNPESVLILANAVGNYKTEIISLLKLLPENNYRLIEFEEDAPALYYNFNCFVHIPVSRESEAFGQVYIESLACRVPSVFTLSGIAEEIAVDKKNCLVVPFKDSNAVYEALNYFIQNHDQSIQIGNEGFNTVKNEFEVSRKISKLEKLYLS
jgi:glycosyltransferase involved in cell wall biosynthesis